MVYKTIFFCGYSQQKNTLMYSTRMVRYVDMNYSELKKECDGRGIKKCSGLRKPILMVLLMMHCKGLFDEEGVYQ